MHWKWLPASRVGSLIQASRPTMVLSVAVSSPQLLRGWHSRDAAGTIWSKRESWAVLANLPGAGSVRVRGALPFSTDGHDNVLEVESNGFLLGRVLNPTRQILHFDAHFGPISVTDDSLNMRFVTRTSFN